MRGNLKQDKEVDSNQLQILLNNKSLSKELIKINPIQEYKEILLLKVLLIKNFLKQNQLSKENLNKILHI